MTPRKRWPDIAERARTDGIKRSRDIQRLGEDAKTSLRQGDRAIVLAMITEMQLSAAQIEAGLRSAKRPNEEE